MQIVRCLRSACPGQSHLVPEGVVRVDLHAAALSAPHGGRQQDRGTRGIDDWREKGGGAGEQHPDSGDSHGFNISQGGEQQEGGGSSSSRALLRIELYNMSVGQIIGGTGGFSTTSRPGQPQPPPSSSNLNGGFLFEMQNEAGTRAGAGVVDAMAAPLLEWHRQVGPRHPGETDQQQSKGARGCEAWPFPGVAAAAVGGDAQPQ